MIKVFTGANDYQIFEAIKSLAVNYDNYERYDGSDIETNKMAEICGGVSLFSSKKMVVIFELSKNKTIWDNLETWLDRLGENNLLVLVEPSLDKRTKAYKLLGSLTEIERFEPLDVRRDVHKLEQWLIDTAVSRQIKLDKPAARELVSRIGVDQWQLSNELDRLSVMGVIDLELVKKYTESSISENVFALLETAINRQPTDLAKMIIGLKINNDPYMTFGLLASQILSIVGLVLGQDRAVAEVAKDIGQNEYALSRLKPLSRKFNDRQLEKIIHKLAQTDKTIKSSDDPWQAIEVFLLNLQPDLN